MNYVYIEHDNTYAYTPDGWGYIYYDTYEDMIADTGLDGPVTWFKDDDEFEAWRRGYDS